MAELAQLSAEDRAEVRAWLNRLTPEICRPHAADLANPAPRLRSPRLADPAKAADFAKQVTELPANASL
jgi:hypothetical protein